MPYKDPVRQKLYKAAYYQKNKIKYAHVSKLRRNGPKRDHILEQKREWNAKNRDTIRVRRHDHYEAHSEAIKEKAAKYKEANPEKVKSWRKALYYRNREANKKNASEWYANNKERARASRRRYQFEHKASVYAGQRAWRKLNPLRRKVLETRRRARKKSAPGECPYEQLKARIVFYGEKCWMCLAAPFYCLDHVKPLSKGGSNWPSNLRPACRPCNSRKRSLWPLPEGFPNWRPHNR